MKYRPRFSLRSVLLVTAFCALALGWLADRTRLREEQNAQLVALKASHHYGVVIDGTAGVRLRVTIVTKPAKKTVETVSVPYFTKFEAVAAEVWVETLPDGKSGNDGDVYKIVLTKDGKTLKECNAHIQKDSRKNMYVNGDACWELGDF